MKTCFACPVCQQPVTATGDYFARGLKCPHCGAGFIPPGGPAPGAARSPSHSGQWILLIGILGLTVVTLLCGSEILGPLVYAAPGLLVLALLIGIFIRLGQLAAKK
jgi:hypothetical protein